MNRKTILINAAAITLWFLGLAVPAAHADCREPGRSAIQSRYRTIASFQRMVHDAEAGLRKSGMHPSYYETQHRIIEDRNRQIEATRNEIEELQRRYCR